MSNKGGLIVFAAPAGGGKSTIINKLRERHPEWGFSCSATTRSPRPGETNGKEYHFLSQDEFLKKVQDGEFLEYEEVHGNLYGTLKTSTVERIAKGEVILFDLDVKGALNIKKNFSEALTIFIEPPSLELLRKRLEHRGTESAEIIQKRLSRADMEMKLSDKFDKKIVNYELDSAVAEIEKIINDHLNR